MGGHPKNPLLANCRRRAINRDESVEKVDTAVVKSHTQQVVEQPALAVLRSKSRQTAVEFFDVQEKPVGNDLRDCCEVQ